jgi:hypothetical protein
VGGKAPTLILTITHHSPLTTHLPPMPDNTPAEIEHQHHDYVGNAIPWYVRAIWIGFWIFAVVYTIRYLFPALQAELLQRQ